MPDRTIGGALILVAEDEYFLADELRTELDDAGAVVLGPVGTLEGTLDLIRSEARIDAAILDINLGGVMVYPAADLLAERGIPFVFTTGYDQTAIPLRFADVVRCEKPINIDQIMPAIGRGSLG